MNAYRRVFFAFIICYALVSCTARASAHLTGMIEIFPFFSWSLFSLVPNVKNEFALRIVELDEEVIEPPRYLEAFGPPFRLRLSSTHHVTIQTWGRALSAGDLVRAKQLRSEFEAAHFSRLSESIKYELVRRSYDVLHRQTNDTINHVLVVGTFETEVSP